MMMPDWFLLIFESRCRRIITWGLQQLNAIWGDEKRQASLTLILLAIIVIMIAEGNAQLGIIIIIIIIDTPTNVMEISNIDF